MAFTASGCTDRLSDVANTVLFRIAQEALTNIERHAAATSITSPSRASSIATIVISRSTLTVWDNGGGFDAQGIASHPKRGIGLRNMMERMEAIGGQFRIESSTAGTAVSARVDNKGNQ